MTIGASSEQRVKDIVIEEGETKELRGQSCRLDYH